MAISLGTEAIVGIRKEGTYGTAIQVTDKVPFTSCTITTDPELAEDASLYGTAGYNGTQIVTKPVGISLECPIVGTTLDAAATPDEFMSSDLLMYMALPKSMSFTSNCNANTGEYSGGWDSFTLACSQGVDSGDPTVFEVAGCKVNSMTLSCDSGGTLMGSFDIIGQTFLPNSATNTPAIMSSLSSGAATPTPYVFSDLSFWFGENDDVLAAGDSQPIGSLSITVSNSLSQIYESSTTPQVIVEPDSDGFREVTINFSLPRVDSANSVSGFTGENAYAMDLLTVASGGAPQTDNRQCEVLFTQGSDSVWFGFPFLRIVSCSTVVSGANLLTEEVSCVGYMPQTAAEILTAPESGISAVSAVAMETKNERIAVPA